MTNLFSLGPAISSYHVDDKVQEAVIDPDLIADVAGEDEDDESQVCLVCEEDDNEDILMYCDSCDKLYHTYCVGLDEVPVGHWFCDHCRAQRDEPPTLIASRSRGAVGRYSRRRHGRTRGQRNRHRQQDRANEQTENDLWQAVWLRTHIDLDFPFDHEDHVAAHMRRQRARTDNDRAQYSAWQRRMQIAEIQGGANRFRDNAQSLLEESVATTSVGPRRPRPATPPQETMEEIRAWQAFDRAREIESNPSTTVTRGRKRKSAPASPAEPENTPTERRIKRPRARRQLDVAEHSDSAESSSRIRVSSVSRPQTDNQPSNGPSFLQSLLKEVQGSTTTPNHREGQYLGSSGLASPTSESPAPSSPILSPTSSNHPSPRAGSTTPPPMPVHFARPGSPTGLSSSVQPVFPYLENGRPKSPPTEASPATANSPTPEAYSPVPKESNGNTSDSENILGFRRLPRAASQHSPHSRSRSNESSPIRKHLSLDAKQDIQKMVASALKPFYSDGKIDKEIYTQINRDVSRKMYERIGAEGVDGMPSDEKHRLVVDVGEEVKKAVEGSTPPPEGNGHSESHT